MTCTARTDFARTVAEWTKDTGDPAPGPKDPTHLTYEGKVYDRGDVPVCAYCGAHALERDLARAGDGNCYCEDSCLREFDDAAEGDEEIRRFIMSRR